LKFLLGKLGKPLDLQAAGLRSASWIPHQAEEQYLEQPGDKLSLRENSAPFNAGVLPPGTILQ
jgi:hypothetical protein